MLCVLVSCGGGDGGSSSAPSSSATAGTATLLPSVKVINSTQANYIAAQTATTWTLRTASSVKPGDVLLLEDAAVKVVSVDTSSGQMVLTVTPAQIEDVFSKLTVSRAFNQNDAEFIPDPASPFPVTFASSSPGSSVALSSVAAPISGGIEETILISLEKPPLSGTLAFRVGGNVSLDYDSSSNAGITGTLDVTGGADGNISMSTEKAITMVLPELPVATLRIPVPISIVDSVLNAVGIRIASIYIPISVGGQAKVEIAAGIQVNGNGQSHVVTTYDAANGFVVTGPATSGALSLTGTPSSTIPTAVAKGTLTAGPYIRARPQLLILNKVASIGADVTAGLYGQGTVTSILEQPYYCLDLQARVEGEISGFLKGVGVDSYASDPITQGLDLGPRFVYPAGGCAAVQFSSPTYTVASTGSGATITVTRTGDISNPATVQYATSDGTAMAGRDYTATSGILTFNPNEASQSFVVSILNNSTNQGGTVNLTLSQPSGGTALGAPSTAVLTIDSITGIWDGTWTSILGGQVTYSFTIQDSQGVLSGRLQTSGPGDPMSATITSGTRSGANVYFSWQYDNFLDPPPYPWNFTGTVSGNTMTGALTEVYTHNVVLTKRP